jgi:hypothetical protein
MTPEWQAYLDALKRTVQATLLTAYHTRECAEAARDASNYARATAKFAERAIELEKERMI